MADLPHIAEQIDDGLLLSRKMLQQSRDLITTSRAHELNSRTAIEQSFRLLASFSKKVDVSCYRLAAATKILVVDDEPRVRESLSAFFEVNGFAVEQASDGVEALRQLERNKFDLVVSDIRMPIMDGLSLAKNVRSNFPSMKIILITGALPKEPNKVATEVGAAYLLSKLRLDDLLAKVNETAKSATT
jgi:two-component system, cell cycle response regulator CpdR